MRVLILSGCLLASIPLAAVEPETLAGSVYSLQQHMRGGAVSPQMPELLRSKRQWALEETGRMLARGETLGHRNWVLPMLTLHGWSLRHEWESFEPAARACSGLLSLLRGIEDNNALAAANLASRLLSLFSSVWMDTDAPAVVRIMDETETWVLALTNRISGPLIESIDRPEGCCPRRYPRPGTSLPQVWYENTTLLQANILHQEAQFPPEQRPWLWETRQQRLLSAATHPGLSLEWRHQQVALWGEVLFHNGRGEEAERLLLGWMRRQEHPVNSPRFMLALMKVLVLDRADMDRASRLMVAADAGAQGESPLEREMYRNLSDLYYSKLVLPGYELRRQRHLQEQKRLERLREADEQHALALPAAKP